MALDVGASFRISAGVAGQAQVDRFNASLKDANQSGGMLTDTMGSLKGAMAGLTTAVVGAALVGLTRQAVDNADALKAMSDRTGIAGEKLSELQYAAELNGASLEEVEVALKKVSTKAFDAATGNKAAAATFEALGISVQGLDGDLKTSDVLLQEIADVLNTVQDRTARTALAVELFGKSGASLIPMLENMKDAREEARRLGVVVGEDFQKQADDFNDNVARMQFLVKSFGTTLANEVIPTLNRFMNELVAGREIFGGYWAALKNIGTTNPFNTAAENAAKYQKQVDDLRQRIESLNSGETKWTNIYRTKAEQIAILNEEMENTKKLVEYFQRMNGQTSTAGAGRGVVNPPMPGNPGAAILARLKAANDKDNGAGGSKESEYDRLLKQLQDQLATTKDLTTYQDILRKIEEGRYKDLAPAQQEKILDLAREVDAARNLRDEEREREAQAKKDAADRKAAAERTSEAQAKEVKHWKDLADPAAKYREEIERIKAALKDGLITQEVADGAVKALNESIEKLGETKDKTKDMITELKDAIEGWGKDATDAFVNFAFGAKGSFSDMVSSMLKEMAKLVVQQQVMGPLFKSLSGAASGINFSSLWPFADGGVMTNDGPVPLRKYASGGIARSPQLALYGEAGPEAYVPLPDGRSIPVTMSGPAASGNTMVNITVNAEGGQVQGDASAAGRLGAAIANAVQVELIRQRRPGGLLAAA